jgi:two-component system, NarL family, invasion response regulator UvrY
MRLLIVDDSPIACQMLRRLFEGVANLEIVGDACCGEDGLEACAALAPDVVVMDWSMPGMSGIEATAEICRRHPGIDLIGYTSTRDGAVHDAFLEAGATAVFAKECALELREHLMRVAAQ